MAVREDLVHLKVLDDGDQATHVVSVRVRQDHDLYVHDTVPLEVRHQLLALPRLASVYEDVPTVRGVQPRGVSLTHVEKSHSQEPRGSRGRP